jgi:hypothetical protein
MPGSSARRTAVAALRVAAASTGRTRILAVRAAARAVSGAASTATAAAARQGVGRVHAWLRRGSARGPVFGQVWKATALRHRLHAVRSGAVPTPAAIGVGILEGDRLAMLDGYGIHDVEHLDGRAFRWFDPVTVLSFDLPPGPHRIEIESGGLRGDIGGMHLAAAWNGRRTPVHADGTVAVVDVHSRGARADLVLLTEPVPGVSPAEHRRLALPVVSITARS